VDNIDVKSATRLRGIVVKNTPGSSTNAVAELVFGLMICLARKIPFAYLTLKDGQWLKKPCQGVELNRKTLGIVGCGRIGRRVAEIAGEGYRMKVIGCDIHPIEDDRIEAVDFDALLRTSDFVTLHLPGQKKPVIGRSELKKMKEGAFLINSSRGENIDEEALYLALKEKRIAGAACDVYREEGKEGQSYKNRLLDLDNFVGVPHIGASTAEAQQKAAIEIAEGVINYLKATDRKWENAVNVGERINYKPEEMPAYVLWVWHEDIPGMFRKISGILEKYNINILNIDAEGIAGRPQGVFKTREKPSLEAIKEIENLDGVHRVTSGN